MPPMTFSMSSSEYAVGDQPAQDVLRAFGGVLQPLHVLHGLVRLVGARGAVGLLQREVRGVRAMESHVVAVQGIGTEADVVHAHQCP